MIRPYKTTHKEKLTEEGFSSALGAVGAQVYDFWKRAEAQLPTGSPATAGQPKVVLARIWVNIPPVRVEHMKQKSMKASACTGDLTVGLEIALEITEDWPLCQ